MSTNYKLANDKEKKKSNQTEFNYEPMDIEEGNNSLDYGCYCGGLIYYIIMFLYEIAVIVLAIIYLIGHERNYYPCCSYFKNGLPVIGCAPECSKGSIYCFLDCGKTTLVKYPYYSGSIAIIIGSLIEIASTIVSFFGNRIPRKPKLFLISIYIGFCADLIVLVSIVIFAGNDAIDGAVISFIVFLFISICSHIFVIVHIRTLKAISASY